MRVISAPVQTAPVQPVRAANTAENRTHREQPSAEAAPSRDARKGDVPATAQNHRPHLWENGATVDAGVTAQKVFHAVYGEAPEASLTEANRAYTKSDELRFRDARFSLRLI